MCILGIHRAKYINLSIIKINFLSTVIIIIMYNYIYYNYCFKIIINFSIIKHTRTRLQRSRGFHFDVDGKDN